MPWTDWVQEPDFAVGAEMLPSRWRTSTTFIGAVEHEGSWVVDDINNAIAAITLPALGAAAPPATHPADFPGIGGFPSNPGRGVGTQVVTGISPSYFVAASYDDLTYYVAPPADVDWAPSVPTGTLVEYETGDTPVLVSGDLELTLTLQQQADDHEQRVGVDVVAYPAASRYSIGEAATLVDELGTLDPNVGGTWTVAYSPTGEQLEAGVVLYPRFTSWADWPMWAFVGTIDEPTDGLAAQFTSILLDPASAYTMRPPRYRYWTDEPEPEPTTTEAVTRLYPRDDSLGLGSAPRIYPPPKRHRVVGGYR